MKKTTVRAGSNIAFIKYWGVRDAALHLPLSNSISMTLADAFTTTTVEWDSEQTLTQDEITLDGVLLEKVAAQRLVNHLDHLRRLAGVDVRARVMSHNNFPMASGIASSASGFTALTVAGAAGLGLSLNPTQLSALARLGSGSASRSLFGGFVEWEMGHDHDSSVAHQLYPADHWNLYDIVAVLSSKAKKTSSAQGHTLAQSSPLCQARIDRMESALAEVRQAITVRDIGQLGPVIEEDALMMHAVMMTGNPALFYWQPGTLAVIQAVREWREHAGIPVYFTIDAGPNIHLICEADQVEMVTERLGAMDDVQRIIVSRAGGAPELLATDIF